MNMPIQKSSMINSADSQFNDMYANVYTTSTVGVMSPEYRHSVGNTQHCLERGFLSPMRTDQTAEKQSWLFCYKGLEQCVSPHTAAACEISCDELPVVEKQFMP